MESDFINTHIIRRKKKYFRRVPCHECYSRIKVKLRYEIMVESGVYNNNNSDN